MNFQNVAAIHDLSAFGRCALTVVIPILSAMGIQVIPLPTALLSTHTGGFDGFSFLDLTDEMEKMAAHWSELDIKFNSIYSGFLGSENQADTVIRFIERFRTPDTIVLIDPVMGDNGVPYSTITHGIREKMKSLVRYADIITPNITEACFLLDLPMTTPTAELLYRLSDFGVNKVVITGIENGEFIAAASYDRQSGETVIYNRTPINKHYPGTGDIFASVLLGNMMSGAALTDAVKFACDFVCDVIADTVKYGQPERNGVMLEKNLYKLINRS